MPLLIAAILMIASLSALELRWPARAEMTARGVNVMAWGCSLASGLTLAPLASAAGVVAINQLGGGWVDLAPWPLPLAAAAYTVAMDAGEYAFHRAQHAVPLLWRMHSLHHSDPNMNVTTTVRHFWAEPLLKTVTIWFAVGLVFRPTPDVLLIYGGCYLYHIVEHANLPISFGRLSWLLNSPAYHRRHHSIESAGHNTNFAGLFPIFDVVFGTYRPAEGWAATGQATAPRSILDVAFWPLRRGSGAPHRP